MWSTFGVRDRIWSSAGTKSSATVQQMQPLASSTMFSSGQVSMPQPFRISPSMPTSPNSLTMMARRLPFGVFEQMADQRRLAGAEKAGDDGAGNAGRRKRSCNVLQERRGEGCAATRPRLRQSGRPRHGIRPSVEVAKSFAPVIEVGAAVDGQVAEDIAPAAVAQDRGAQAALAVAEAFDRCGCVMSVADAAAACRWPSNLAGAGMSVRAVLVAAGRADDDSDAGAARRWLDKMRLRLAPKDCRRRSKLRLLARDTRQAIGLLCPDGRSPGSRVVALCRLPGNIPSGFRPRLVAYSCGDSRGVEILRSRTAFPLSSSRCGEETVLAGFRLG